MKINFVLSPESVARFSHAFSQCTTPAKAGGKIVLGLESLGQRHIFWDGDSHEVKDLNENYAREMFKKIQVHPDGPTWDDHLLASPMPEDWERFGLGGFSFGGVHSKVIFSPRGKSWAIEYDGFFESSFYANILAELAKKEGHLYLYSQLMALGRGMPDPYSFKRAQDALWFQPELKEE